MNAKITRLGSFHATVRFQTMVRFYEAMPAKCRAGGVRLAPLSVSLTWMTSSTFTVTFEMQRVDCTAPSQATWAIRSSRRLILGRAAVQGLHSTSRLCTSSWFPCLGRAEPPILHCTWQMARSCKWWWRQTEAWHPLWGKPRST